jgi:hypothetical protein
MTSLSFALAPFAICGAAAVCLTAAWASPLKAPPPLQSAHRGAMAIDRTVLSDVTRFQARDSAWLAYRNYPKASGALVAASEAAGWDDVAARPSRPGAAA